MKTQSWSKHGIAAGLAQILLAGPALAHSGAASAHDLFQGLIHPLTGADHLLAMVAVGLWAGQSGGRAMWTLLAAFPLAMTGGAALAIAGWSLPLVEPMILASILLLGGVLLVAARPPAVAGVALVVACALFHGQAHGAELPADGNAMVFVAGFVAATFALHACGAGLVVLGRRLAGATAALQLSRGAGLVIAAAGGVLALT